MIQTQVRCRWSSLNFEKNGNLIVLVRSFSCKGSVYHSFSLEGAWVLMQVIFIWSQVASFTCICEVLKDKVSPVKQQALIRKWIQRIKTKSLNLATISSYSMIVRVREVMMKRTVVDDWRFDNLSGSHLESQGLPLRLSKRQSPTTVFFRTTLTRTITQYELLILLRLLVQTIYNVGNYCQ